MLALDSEKLMYERPLSLSPVYTHYCPGCTHGTAHRLVARLRFDYSKCADDPHFEALVRHLNLVSPLFARLWRIPE